MERTRIVEPSHIEAKPSFSVFYRDHFAGAVALAHALAGSRRAEDVAQDALLAAYRKWDELDEPEHWLRRVIANRSRSALRRAYAEARAVARIGSPPPEVAVPVPTDDFWAVVRKLPRRQAQVIALRYLEELSTIEVAAVLDITEATVRVHLHRARQKLATKFGDSS